jgi:hypothetical protein
MSPVLRSFIASAGKVFHYMLLHSQHGMALYS